MGGTVDYSVINLMIEYLQRILNVIFDFISNFGKTTTSTTTAPTETETTPTTVVRN